MSVITILTVAPTYTLEQIKAAFYREFCGMGEIYFGDIDSKKDAEEWTQAPWDDFLEELQKELVE